jgi:hypothetical protein
MSNPAKPGSQKWSNDPINPTEEPAQTFPTVAAQMTGYPRFLPPREPPGHTKLNEKGIKRIIPFYFSLLNKRLKHLRLPRT